MISNDSLDVHHNIPRQFDNSVFSKNLILNTETEEYSLDGLGMNEVVIIFFVKLPLNVLVASMGPI